MTRRNDEHRAGGVGRRPGYGLIGRIARFWRANGGNVAPLMAIMIIPITAAFGMTVEAGNWYLVQRAAQNAADAAALAAANNGGTTSAGGTCSGDTTGPGTYDCEALETAAQYGFPVASNVTVSPSYQATAGNCPGGSGTTANPKNKNGCYTVVITKQVPLSLLRVVGYTGDTTLNGQSAKTVTATATASAAGANGGVPSPFCIITKNDFTGNGGGNNQNYHSCSIYSGGSATCNGSKSDNGMTYGFAAGTSSCGQTQSFSNWANAPYDPMSAVTPPSTTGCSTTITQLNQASFTNKSLVSICSGVNVQVTQAITISSPTILVISGGTSLNMNGLSFTTSGTNASLSIYFVGSCLSGTACLNGNGAISITAPTSTGVAIWSDPAITNTANNKWTFSGGNGLALTITGGVYAPNVNIVTNGNVGGGGTCSIYDVNNLTLNGNSTLAVQGSDCTTAYGSTLPTAPFTSQIALEQ